MLQEQTAAKDQAHALAALKEPTQLSMVNAIALHVLAELITMLSALFLATAAILDTIVDQEIQAALHVRQERIVQ